MGLVITVFERCESLLGVKQWIDGMLALVNLNMLASHVVPTCIHKLSGL